MDCLQAIDQRYSYRGPYAQTPVPRKDLIRILEAGLAAPSGCNEQNTSLIGIDDPALLAALGKVLNKPNFASAPAAICVLTQRIIAYEDTCFSVQDYAAAIENMLLAITAMGYASCWVEGYVHNRDKARIAKEMEAILGIQAPHELVAFMPLGVPTEQGTRTKKKPFAERAWINGFQKA